MNLLSNEWALRFKQDFDFESLRKPFWVLFGCFWEEFEGFRDWLFDSIKASEVSWVLISAHRALKLKLDRGPSASGPARAHRKAAQEVQTQSRDGERYRNSPVWSSGATNFLNIIVNISDI